MPIPTELVGSLPRPMKLQEAYAAYDEGKIAWRSCRPSRTPPPRTRSSAWRRPASRSSPTASSASRASRPTRSPTRWPAPASPTTSPATASSSRSSTTATTASCRASPAARSATRPSRRSSSRRTAAIATHPVKQAVIAPSMLMLLYPLEGEIDGYSREQFLADLCDEVEKDIRQCFDAGAVRVSIDFTEGRLANKNDSRNPWTGKDMLQEFIDLNNRVIDRFSAEERANIGIHTCPGGDCDSVHSKEVPYEKLLEHDVRAQRRLLPHPVRERGGPRERSTSCAASTAARTPNGVAAGVLHGRHQPADARGRDAPSRSATSS